MRALAATRGEQVVPMMRPHLTDRDPGMVVTAAMALASSSQASDVESAIGAMERIVNDQREAMAPARREVAQALGALTQPEFRRLLVPLMYDQNRDVALEAIRSAGRLPGEDYLFVPQLVSLLRNRLLKAAARNVLVGYGPGVVPTLAYFLRDQDEDVWVRRHIPSTLARIPGQQTMDVLVDALNEKEGFLRYKVISAIGRMRLDDPSLKVPAEKVHELLGQESKRYLTYLSFRYNLVRTDKAAENTLLARALHEKVERTVDRIYRLLGLIYPLKDILAARWSLENGDPRIKASAAEYLDNTLDSNLRKRIMPVLEELPIEEKVKRANTILKTRVRDAEDSVAQLVHDEDQIVAAAAIQFVDARGLWNLADDLEYILEHRDVTRLLCLRGRVVGPRGPPPVGRRARLAMARAVAGRRARRSAAPPAALPVHVDRRDVPGRGDGPAGAPRERPHALRVGSPRHGPASSCSTAPCARRPDRARRTSPRQPPSGSTRCSRAPRSRPRRARLASRSASRSDSSRSSACCRRAPNSWRASSGSSWTPKGASGSAW